MQDTTAPAEEAIPSNNSATDATPSAQAGAALPSGVDGIVRATVVAPQLTLPTGAADDSAHAGGLFPMSFGAGLVWNASRTDGVQQFFALTTRGPTLPGPMTIDATGRRIPSRYCLTPVFQPRIMRLDVSETASRTLAPVMLANEEGKPLYGLPPRGSVAETALSLANERISGSDRAIAPQGLARTEDDCFWVVDGFTSSLRQFSAMGVERSAIRPGEGLPGFLEGRFNVLRGLAALPDGRLAVLDRTGFGTDRFIGVIVADPASRTNRAYLLDAEGERPQDLAALADGTLLLLVRVPDAFGAGRYGLRLLRLDLSRAEDVSDLMRTELLRRKRGTAGAVHAETVLDERDFEALGLSPDDADVMRAITLMPDGRTLAMITENRFGARIHVEHRVEGVAEGVEAGSDAIRHYVIGADGTVTFGGERSEDRFIVSRLDPAKALTQLLLVSFHEPFVKTEAAPAPSGVAQD